MIVKCDILNLTWEIGENKRQDHAAYSFYKIDMQHRAPSPFHGHTPNKGATGILLISSYALFTNIEIITLDYEMTILIHHVL